MQTDFVRSGENVAFCMGTSTPKRNVLPERGVFRGKTHITFLLRRFSDYYGPTFDRADKVDVEQIACGRCCRIGYKRTSICA